MAQTKKKYGLDLFKVLPELDKGNKKFYSALSEEEKKSYSAFVLMRYMSILSDQNKNKEYAIIAVNDLVNLGFWELSKHPELQHLLLCVAGLGTKQYHQWIPNKSKSSKTSNIDNFFRDLYPEINDIELEILKKNYNKDSFKQLTIDAGKSDQEIKELLTEWRKIAE